MKHPIKKNIPTTTTLTPEASRNTNTLQTLALGALVLSLFYILYLLNPDTHKPLNGFTGAAHAEELVQEGGLGDEVLGEKIRAYILTHPEIIEEAMVELGQKRERERMAPGVKLYRDYLENDHETPVLGNPDGDVTIIEFFDYRCLFCKREAVDLARYVEQDGNIRLVLKHYPILDRQGSQPLSRLAALAAIASERQRQFPAYHRALMTAQGALTEDMIYKIADNSGLDVAVLKQDMNNPVVLKQLEDSFLVGQDIGVEGTPAFFIGEEIVSGALGMEAIANAVRKTRAAQQSSR